MYVFLALIFPVLPIFFYQELEEEKQPIVLPRSTGDISLLLLYYKLKIGRYKSRTGSTRTASPGQIDSDQLGSNKKIKIT